MFPLIMFCLAYLANFGLYPRLIYPKSNRGIHFRTTYILCIIFGCLLGEFERSLHRAFLYNQVPKNASVKPQIFSENILNLPTIKPNSFKLVCYYSFPSSSVALQPDEIDPYLCTHINAAFAGVSNNSISMDSDNTKVLKELVKLKIGNPNLKIMLCVGGASNDGGFSEMVMNHTNRKR